MKSEKFGAKFFTFLKFASYNGGVRPNLNQRVKYYGAKQRFHTLETQL